MIEKNIDLSIVMPAYNESMRICPTLNDIERSLSKHFFTEVIIVDDGSTDNIKEELKSKLFSFKLYIIRLSINRGYGYAARKGIEKAQGKRILLCDADGSIPFYDLKKLWFYLDNGYDYAVGSRLIKSIEKIQRPLYRVFISRVWVFLVQLLQSTDIRDTQCGFKLFDAQVAKIVYKKTFSYRFFIHVETLVIAKKLGFKGKEVGVMWNEKSGSKVSFGKDSLQMFWELLILTWKNLLSK